MSVNKDLYFDWAGTAIPDGDILRDALEKALEYWGNPSSVHDAGKEARQALEAARADCAKVMGCNPSQIYFTSGGTESDHIPLLSVLNRPQKGNILVSSIEHPALREMASELKHCGITVRQIRSDKNGFISPESVLSEMDEDTLFVTVMAVNNETGAIQPVREIADCIAKNTQGKRRPKFHVDCVQALGKIPLDFSPKGAAGIDSAAFSAHKICGPRGIGILYLANPTEPFLKGGGQEGGIRSGTENLFGALAFAECLKRHAFVPGKDTARLDEQKEWTDDFINKLNSIESCRIIPYCRGKESSAEMREKFSPWVIQAAFKNIPGQVMLRALNEKGIYISTGSACSSKKASRPVLEAMGVDGKDRETSVRFSFGPKTTRESMNRLFEAVKEITARFK